MQTNNNSIFFNETIRQIINDLKKDVSSQVISAKFHNTIAKMIFEISIELSKIYSINKVALSGGCFQNKFLMERIKLNFSKSKLKLFTNINLSTTDANISVGQVFIVLTRNSYNDFF